MGKIVAVVNQKGGVGKTTSAVNLTAALTAAGARVLLCDFDPQANATSGLGVDKKHAPHSAYEMIIGEVSPEKAVMIGDSVAADIPAANAAGVFSILFTNGRPAPAEHGACAAARSYEEALALILG